MKGMVFDTKLIDKANAIASLVEKHKSKEIGLAECYMLPTM